MYKIVHKPWGKEEWLALNEFYCYKRIYINSGYKTSYQYHQFKHETNYIIEGTAEVWLENEDGVVEKKILSAGDFFNVKPPKKHRVIAITDIILQEVSTPHVDDVFRIDDEFNRSDGKIESEHKTPAVLILTAGIGSRLGNITKNINKAMIPINNKAILTHIIEKFPKDYDFIIALGYKGDELRQYCNLSHSDLKITFVEIDNIEGIGSGPGYSTLKCKEHLQRPFYFITSDCIINSKIPHLDGNWLGTYPTGYPEKYSTLEVDDDNNILNFVNKSDKGFNNAFIGIASIWDYDVFWKELESNIIEGEMVSAFNNISNYPSFKSKQLDWLDTGNLDDLNKTKIFLNDDPLSLFKTTDEITYKVGNFLKFSPNIKSIENKKKRAEILSNLIPSNFISTKNFISYKWESGNTLYEIDSLEVYEHFLIKLLENINNSVIINVDNSVYQDFYVNKTNSRKKLFTDKYGQEYLNRTFNINGRNYNSLDEILSSIKFDVLFDNNLYSLFHGDLQFDNIIYNSDNSKFYYIDWRESFGNRTEGGDIYYDLAKLYGGLIIPYNLMKKENSITLNEGSTAVTYTYDVSNNLTKFKTIYEKWLTDNKYDLNKVRLITGLIFLNMSPLHDDKFGKMLWFKSIEILSEYVK